MQSNNQPAKFETPFAQNDASKAEIPNTTSDPGRASQTLGFPPLTGLPPEAGGVPPQLPDMNGALNQVARIAHWYELGGVFPYDSAFANSSAVGGYPRGARLRSLDFTGSWLSAAESNVANPDTSGAGWVPGYHYGATTLASQAGGTVVLTPAQAAKPTLFVSGALTSNLIIEVPAWVYDWTVYNSTSGPFTVSMRTPGRPAVVVPQSSVPANVKGNGTDIIVVVADVPLASTTTAGRARYATTQEAINGAIQDAAVTPFGAQQLIAQRVRRGADFVELVGGGSVRIGDDGGYYFQSAGGTITWSVGPDGFLTNGWVPTSRIPGLQDALNSKATTSALATTNAAVAAKADASALAATNAAVATKYDKSGGTISGSISLLGSATGDVRVAYRDPQDTVTRFYETHSNNTWSLNAADDSGAPTGPVVSFDRVTRNASFGAAVSAAAGFDTPSSRAIKNDLGPFPYGLQDVRALRGALARYAYKDDETQRARLGLYLEDVRPIAPEVAGDKALQELQLIPMLIAAIDDLAAQVEALQAARQADR